MNTQVLQKQLPIGKIKKIQRFTSGQINDVYKITAESGLYTLRLYNNKMISEIEFEVALLRHIKNIPTPRLIKIKDSWIREIHKKPAILYHYILGQQRTTFSKKQLEEVGKFIATFHNSGKHFSWNKKRYKYYDLPNTKISKYASVIKKANLPYLSLLPSIISDLKKYRLSSRLPSGPIHVDIKPENILFDNGELSGVIDFDNAYIGPLMLDLAKSMVWFGIKNKSYDIKQSLPVYTGYCGKRKLSQLEYTELYKAIKFAFVSHVFVDFYNRAKGAISADYFKFMVKNFYHAYKKFNQKENEFYKLL